eukprot:9838237-Karenia_brevis.AAC.1
MGQALEQAAALARRAGAQAADAMTAGAQTARKAAWQAKSWPERLQRVQGRLHNAEVKAMESEKALE